MKLLVRRFVTAEQRKRDDFGITEDDVMEIRQDISTLRFELIDIFNKNGMKTPSVDPAMASCECWRSTKIEMFRCNLDVYGFAVAGKKGKMMERRILKDFQIGIVESLTEAMKTSASKDVFSSIAKAIGKKASQKK